ncbi:DUF2975 domain-containing protein [uncultured Acetobacteroides sp.]|uniref:DUF2975 domain-containing protein n=1 Tax=uncultured Acetobacteroides sp. TaxID=1760811 RepID=UPI0029F56A60|nr:DUF2975 domain-containing protein [uncultured Acetobacteroides sp.]
MDKKLLIRVRLLNVVIALLLIAPLSTDFVRGFKEGVRAAEGGKQKNVSTELYFVSLRPLTPKSELKAETNNGSEALATITEATVVLHKNQKSLGKEISDAAMVVLTLGIVVWLIILIWKITVSLNWGNLLTRRNIKHLRAIGILLIAKEAVSIASQYVDLHYLRSVAQVKGYEMVVDLSCTQIVIGLMLLVFAEILAVANRIKEEQELTI